MNNNITVKEAISKCDMLYWSTQKDRKNTLRNANVFLNFYGKNNLMNDVSTETIREFKYHLRINHKYSNDTINRKCAALSKLITSAKGCPPAGVFPSLILDLVSSKLLTINIRSSS